jgi:hypothetical protein
MEIGYRPMPLSLENLYSMSDVPVKEQIASLFGSQIRQASSVRGTFFPSAQAAPVGAPDPAWVDNIAIALVCSSIGQSALYDFHLTVNQVAAVNYWQREFAENSASAVKASQVLYDWAFPRYAEGSAQTTDRYGGPPFQAYLDDNPKRWATELSSHLASPAFINTEVLKLMAAEPDWSRKLNLTLYKLHRLDPSSVDDILNVWSRAIPDKPIQKEWHTYNHLHVNLFRSDQFISEVNTAITKRTQTGTEPKMIQAGGGTTIIDIPLWTNGVAVVNFLNSNAKNLGFTTPRFGNGAPRGHGPYKL